MPIKARWSDIVHQPYSIVADLATIAGLACYGIAGLRLLDRYRTLLASQRSDDHRFVARWLSRAMGATLVLLPIWTGYALWDAVAPIGYVGLMGLYVAIAAFALYIGIKGWRHAALVGPVNSSATFQFAENARRTGRVRLFGASTGGNRRGINDGCLFFVRLPASSIEFDLPLIGYFPLQPQPDAGIVPDVAIATSIADVRAGRDPTMERAAEWLQQAS